VSSLNLHLTYRANPNVLINDNFRKFDKKTGYYSHTIGKDKIIFQLTQPYMISSMKLRLWDGDGRSYRYFIETSVDKSNWKIVADRRNEDCKSCQTLQFNQRPVVYIRITGTHNTANNVSF
jgi:BTB/POZ domain-containing protein 9